MALFNDGSISTIDDLSGHDSGLLQVAGVEAIDLTRKLDLARESIGVELTALLPQPNADFPGIFSSGLDLGHVVVTTPLRLWHTFLCLTMVYRDAYGSQLNDRYQGKWKEYDALTRWAKEKLIETGLGMVSDPIPQALPGVLSSVPGDLAGTTYYVTLAWVNSQGDEGLPAQWKALTVNDGQMLVVAGVSPPSNAVGWNAYVGLSPDSMTVQTTVLQDPATSWALAGMPSSTGRLPGSGQQADFIRPMGRILQRG